MRLVTRSQNQQIDQQSQQVPGLSEEILMEQAGLRAAQWIEKNILKNSHIQSILLLAGPGHNGADGFAVIRHIFEKGRSFDVMTVANSDRPLWKKQKSRLPAGVSFLPLGALQKKYDLVIDALFGIGLNKNISGSYAECIQSLNESAAQVVSLDTPSGLDVTTGLPLGVVVKAHHTLSFGLCKTGFLINDGPGFCGKIHVLDIGFPRDIVRAVANNYFSVSKKWVLKNRPRFDVHANKAKRGRSFVIAGSKEYPGAGVLCAKAALRSGSGYVLLGQQDPPLMALENPDFLVRDLRNTTLDNFKFDAVAIGPGAGTGPELKNWILQLIKNQVEKVVIDADAITVCVQENLFPLPASWVATPHAGELSRVLKVTSAEIETDRFRYAQEGQKKMGCQVLLKGFHSILAFGDKAVVVPTGNQALAKSGTGDVLTGMIVSFMSQGLGTTPAALIACYFHGAAADLWVRQRRDPASFMASDLVEILPRLLYMYSLPSSQIGLSKP